MAINTSRIIKSDIFLDIFYGILRAYCRTFRISVINEAPWQDYLQKGGSLLFCCWHQQVFPTLAYIRKYRELSPPLMISLSNDGEIGAGIVRRFGWTPVRGSSSKGGLKALKQMIRELRRSRLAGHIVDGPQGPSGIVKPGAISLALAARAVIVPVSISADRAWFFNSWDRFMLPKPFAGVRFAFGEMIHLNGSEEKTDVEAWRCHLESVMRPYLIHC
ncbi:MAG: lysophospholipid acyltransferase family protein [Deltaproteobacteria bacterium]|nr:lysophospholipid acyltransferase family protein [Deltaproteobacteria bacterium]